MLKWEYSPVDVKYEYISIEQRGAQWAVCMKTLANGAHSKLVSHDIPQQLLIFRLVGVRTVLNHDTSMKWKSQNSAPKHDSWCSVSEMMPRVDQTGREKTTLSISFFCVFCFKFEVFNLWLVSFWMVCIKRSCLLLLICEFWSFLMEVVREHCTKRKNDMPVNKVWESLPAALVSRAVIGKLLLWWPNHPFSRN